MGSEKQVAQWAMIAHHGASIMLGDTSNLRCSKEGNSELETMTRNYFKNIRHYASFSYLQVLKGLNKNCRENQVNVLFFDAQRAPNSAVSDGI